MKRTFVSEFVKENKKQWRRDTDTERQRGGREREKHRKGRKKREVKCVMTHCAALAFCPPSPYDWEIVRHVGVVLDSQNGKQVLR